MKVGSIETIEEEEKNSTLDGRQGLKNRRVRSGGSDGGGDDDESGGKGGGGGSDRDDGENKADKEFFEELNEYPSNKFRIGTGFLLVVVLMTFAGIIGAYIVISTNGIAEWTPFSLPAPVWFSTVLILASSFTFIIANKALLAEKQEKAKNWFLATTVLGGMFIASQLVAWLVLVQQGVYLQSNPYAGFFYILTALHAIHLLGGIIALGYVVLRTWQKTEHKKELKKRKMYSNAVSWYWHFMDGLWIFLLVLLGFWK